MTSLAKRLLPLIAVLLLVAPLYGDGKEKEDPNKTFLLGVGKLLKSGDAAGIAAYFPKKGKVQLTLRGIKSDKYRDEQAKSLLTEYFKRIDPIEYKLKKVETTAGKFESKYKLKSEGTKVEGTTWVHFEKEEDTWTITGIVES